MYTPRETHEQMKLNSCQMYSLIGLEGQECLFEALQKNLQPKC